ncbi:MAG: hypothetical protein IJX28_00900 [Clostridia bacterium]|nr:hypothetical protein [Clostridia bacterium]
MKKFTKILALTLVAVMLVCTFASCAKKLSGDYEGEVNFVIGKASVTYSFSGSKVTVTSKTTVLGNVNTTTYEGTYEIAENDDGTMEITLTIENGDDNVKSGTYTLEEGEDYIKIAGIQYNKVEK